MSALARVVELLRTSVDDPETATLEHLRQSDGRPWEAFVPKDARITAVEAGGVPALWVDVPGSSAERVVVWLHGGGYVLGSALGRRGFAAELSRLADARVLVPDFRLAPEHPFPAAVDDALAVYRWAAERVGPEHMVIGGESAGGGLAISTVLAARDMGLPLPAGVVPVSPWTDLALTGASYLTNMHLEPVATDGAYARIRDLYLQGHDPRDPLASPLYADLSGLPPFLVMVGGAETLLDDARSFAEAVDRAGGRADLRIEPDMVHYWHLFSAILPEGQEAVRTISEFARRVYAGSVTRS